jgi:hypothetical protein
MYKRFFPNEVQSGLSRARLRPVGCGAEAKVKEADPYCAEMLDH